MIPSARTPRASSAIAVAGRGLQSRPQRGVRLPVAWPGLEAWPLPGPHPSECSALRCTGATGQRWALVGGGTFAAGRSRRSRSFGSGSGASTEVERPVSLSQARLDELLEAEITTLSLRNPEPVSLQSILDTTKNEREMAQLLHKEVPIHYAQRIKMLESLPGWETREAISRVRSMYVTSFKELRLTNPSDTEAFREQLRTIRKRHAHTNLLVAGFRTYQHLEETAINKWLDNFFTLRIFTNLLLSQYIEMGDADGDKSNPYQSSINPQCHPYEIARQAAHVIGDLCTNWYGNAPDIVVTDAGAQPFPFVPRYLFYILSELLKNSVRASIEHHGMMTSTSISDAISEGHVPPIQVLVSSDANMSSIRISDEGGGIPVDRLSHAWSYLYTTAEPIHVPTTQASVDAPTDLRRLETGALPSDYSLSEASDPGQSALIKSPLAGLGCGLPLSRLYARCLGGQLKLHTLPRVGCDVFVYLNRLGHCNDEDLDSNRKRAEIAQEISRLQAMMAEKRQEG